MDTDIEQYVPGLNGACVPATIGSAMHDEFTVGAVSPLIGSLKSVTVNAAASLLNTETVVSAYVVPAEVLKEQSES